ncbi:TonB-dependent receptor [Parapedobacter tibetensis]|uniref:TonB-dependent receptor n=1 Tax=Parapedobacter tibetensis TaxID=2972951 RepID=UPI00214D70FB|nr:TonB-dependent receptor [Parapedobacter tibetensis]
MKINTFYARTPYGVPLLPPKLLLIMKLTTLLLIVCFVQVSASVYSQRINLNQKDVGVEEVLKSIENQTDFHFVYDGEEIVEMGKLTVNMRNASIKKVLDDLFGDKPFSYKIFQQTIVIRKLDKQASKTNQQQDVITGEVRDENGNPLPGVNVSVKGRNTTTVTGQDGRFKLTITGGPLPLQFSFLGLKTQELLSSTTFMRIQMVQDLGNLDEVVVIGYGTTTQRLNTGSVASITGTDIANQPIVNPLAALQGRVSGLMISSMSGMPGASFNVQLRGENSIKSGNNPLFIIDGVPFSDEPLNQFNGASGRQNPLNSINPADIERIDVLKDADATAIYGSRGANGVILITTKKGTPGKMTVDFNLYSGWTKAADALDMLSTDQYLELRREAFANDGAEPTENNAPDLLLWDQQASTDWQKELMGHSAPMTQAQLSFSGGNERTRFLISGNYLNQGNVMPGSLTYQRGSSHLNINHRSEDGKFTINASVNYAADHNNSITTDLSQYYNQVPNYPIYTESGELYWFGTSMQNPFAFEHRSSNSKTSNLISNAVLEYELFRNLDIKTSLGYTKRGMDQIETLPKPSFNPVTYPGSSGSYGFSDMQSYIVEPQLNYLVNVNRSTFKFLLGGTWQQSVNEGHYLYGTSYASDAQLDNMQAAGSLIVRNFNASDYRYQAIFGRINYNLADKYLANINLRRDGSSRFGPGRRYGNFGSLGLAWVFSSEDFATDHLPFLSFGKLRTSYGITGNDQIGNYQYLDTWSSGFAYQGISGQYPARVYNPDYGWEENRKFEAALELGFFNDRLLVNTGYYNNRSDNQLVGVSLAPQTGFTSYIANQPALVENSGWEFDINSTNFSKGHFSWSSGLNLTIPRNVLLEFPNLESSPDANSYTVGESIRIVKGFDFTGVDPQTGIGQYRDVDGNGSLSAPGDYITLGNLMPNFYGGLSNDLRYKNISLNFLFQFVKQEGPYLNYGPQAFPYGALTNVDVSALDRWRAPGDITDIPRATALSSSDAYGNFRDYYRYSSAVWGDASYVRLKNLSLRYDISSLVRQLNIKQLSIYFQGQNLLTFTKYRGLDPETPRFDRSIVSQVNPFGAVRSAALPTLRTYTFGLQLAL